MKRGDPVRLRLRRALNRAHDHLQVLALGASEQLKRCYDHEEVANFLDLMNDLFPSVIATAKKAEDAYLPYRRYRRVRVRPRAKKGRKKK